MTSSSSGASRTQSVTCSSRSMNVGSAQWRSSTTSTSGRRRARVSSTLRMAQNASSGATGSPPGLSSSPARAMAGSASPATCSNRPLAPSASTSGHQVRPSPYGRQRPAATVARSPSASVTSATSRDLPTPAAPRTVSSWQDRCSTACSNASVSCARSRTRPTIGARWRCGRPEASDATEQQSERRQRRCLALDRQRCDGFGLDRVPHQPIGVAADQDVARPRGLLEPGGDVDDVARGEEAAGRGVARDRLARVHADPHAELDAALRSQLVAEGGDLLAHGGCRAHRAQRIVLVGDRDAEDRHHGIADVVLDRAAVCLDDIAHADEPALHRPAQRLGIHAFSERRGSDHVGEDDGDDLAALAGDTRCRHRRPTGRTEAGSLGRPLATPRARLHGPSLESRAGSARDVALLGRHRAHHHRRDPGLAAGVGVEGRRRVGRDQRLDPARR